MNVQRVEKESAKRQHSACQRTTEPCILDVSGWCHAFRRLVEHGTQHPRCTPGTSYMQVILSSLLLSRFAFVVQSGE